MLMKVKEVKGCVGKGSDDDGVRKQVLEKLDNELAKGDERAALFLVKQSLTQPGGLRCFSAARLVPRRLYTLDELKLTGIEVASLLSPVDTTLGSIENLQIAAVLGGVAAWNAFELSPKQLFYISLGLLFLWTLDLHEAGHFLIAYLLGILPKSYTLLSLEALSKEGSLNVQARTNFVEFEFVEETNIGKMSSTMLNIFSCIALAGVATEYLLYGYAEGDSPIGLESPPFSEQSAPDFTVMTCHDIPVISLAGIYSDSGDRASICRKIVEAFEEWGIFQIVDHGIEAHLIADMPRLAREFFALPPQEKLRFDMSGGKKGGFIVPSHLQLMKNACLRGNQKEMFSHFIGTNQHPVVTHHEGRERHHEQPMLLTATEQQQSDDELQHTGFMELLMGNESPLANGCRSPL
uniref:Non-haem dioxygenase N-terminal domain-containing protein n=1 Tax=Chenopodium quinoa TaxID=63459 RepID=A0A803MRI1_CHEQI